MQPTPRLRSFLTIVIATLLSLTALAPGTATAFGDVEDDAYYSDAVAWMAREGITTGIEAGCYGPHLAVTRGQVATFLHRLDESLGNDPDPAAHPFVDVTASYQQTPVGWLYNEDLTTGVTSTRFAPNTSITRGDFAVLLWRYAGSPAPAAPSPFGDVSRLYQRNAVAWLAEQGVTTGTSASTFDPNGVVDRAQVATFLYRFVEPTEVEPLEPTTTCSRDLRVALVAGGLTATEARCASPLLTGFEVNYLVAVVTDQATASFDLIVAAANVGSQCLTSDRVADLARLFL